jgi:hypothetical protein
VGRGEGREYQLQLRFCDSSFRDLVRIDVCLYAGVQVVDLVAEGKVSTRSIVLVRLGNSHSNSDLEETPDLTMEASLIDQFCPDRLD